MSLPLACPAVRAGRRLTLVRVPLPIERLDGTPWRLPVRGWRRALAVLRVPASVVEDVVGVAPFVEDVVRVPAAVEDVVGVAPFLERVVGVPAALERVVGAPLWRFAGVRAGAATLPVPGEPVRLATGRRPLRIGRTLTLVG